MASDKPTTAAGRQLYGILPEVYRTRDSEEAGGGDLARFLDACGELLDRIRATLDQRLADSFPDNPTAGRACQPWLLPYFAQLLDVRLVSPDEKGRRDEVANAVAWRQRKGTLTAIEQIAEAVGRMEVEIQEGWRRTALTPRIGMPRLPAGALGEDPALDQFRNHSLWAARHPDLPAVTADLRYPTRAMQVTLAADGFPSNPVAKLTSFAGTPLWWRQVNPHGAPCFPGSYDDVSRRTLDLRTPDWRQGQIHPKRVILHAPPPLGFFEPGLFPVQGDTLINDDREQLLEDLVIDGTLTVSAGRVTLRRCAVRAVEVTVAAGARAVPVVTAEECLFGRIEAPGLVRLEYCTVLDQISCGRLQASDSLFAGKLDLVVPLVKDKLHCIRFSRVPPGFSSMALLSYRNTSEEPVFYSFEFDQGGGVVRRTARFGEPGCAVLHPASAAALRFGGEDGGEVGAYHGWRYSLLMAAVLDKLKEFLPVGMEAVVVPDLRLRRAPIPPCDKL